MLDTQSQITHEYQFIVQQDVAGARNLATFELLECNWSQEEESWYTLRFPDTHTNIAPTGGNISATAEGERIESSFLPSRHCLGPYVRLSRRQALVTEVSSPESAHLSDVGEMIEREGNARRDILDCRNGGTRTGGEPGVLFGECAGVGPGIFAVGTEL